MVQFSGSRPIQGRQGNEQEAVHLGADHWEAAGSRGWLGPGVDGRPGLPYLGHCRTDLLSLAPGVRWFKGRTGQTAQGPGAGEDPAATVSYTHLRAHETDSYLV